MRSSVLAGALALAGFSVAFSDSSPWFVSSTTPLTSGLKHDGIQTTDRVLKSTKEFLSKCPTDSYAIVVQPGLHYADLTAERGSPELELMKVVDRTPVNNRLAAPEVVGEVVDGLDLKQFIIEACKKQNKEAQVAHLDLRSLPAQIGDARTRSLKSNDEEAVHSTLGNANKDSYTLIFFGTSNAAEPSIYEPDFEEVVMMDLKRSVQGQPSRRASNETEWNKLPLFEKYQFFTPGIFMGLLAVILLGSILTVGIKALSSLEVSYGAFEKDMGPAAQKKQQ